MSVSPERINKELGRHWSCLFWLKGIPSSSTLLSRRPFPSCPGVIFARWLSSAAWWPHNPRISWCNPSAKSGGEQSRALSPPFSSECSWCGRGATLCLKYAAAGTDWPWLRCTGKGERGKGNRKPTYEVGSFTFCLCEEAFVSLGNKACGSNARHHRLSRHFGFPSYIYVISTIKWRPTDQLLRHRVGFSNLPKINFNKADERCGINTGRLTEPSSSVSVFFFFLSVRPCCIYVTRICFYLFTAYDLEVSHSASFCVVCFLGRGNSQAFGSAPPDLSQYFIKENMNLCLNSTDFLRKAFGHKKVSGL